MEQRTGYEHEVPLRRKRKIAVRSLVLFGALCIVLLLAGWDEVAPPAHARYHGSHEGGERGGGIGLVSGNNTYFMASGNCYGCHGIDTMGTVWANHDAQGRDVNMADAWRSTMMANSARDPFFKAKVEHEVAVNPGNQQVLEDKCAGCHAPMGQHDKHMTVGGYYSMAELQFDLVAQDGVSCFACHRQDPDSNGFFFNGQQRYDTALAVYGPYDEVFTGAMESFIGLTPQFGEHIAKSTLCAGCHTLISATEDLAGNPTGDRFVEQATYHEWVNSEYGNSAGANATTCQGCHMPRLADGIIIAGLYDWLTPRTPYGEHQLAGGNVFMLQLLKDNLGPLGLTASSAHFDTTIARTNRMLQQQTLLLQTTLAVRDADSAFIDVELINLAGHKFPSGYPSRRAFIELIALDADGDTLFQSGRWDGAYELVGHDADYEPHHSVITTPGQAQIYEMVMGDVNGDKTTVLMRAKEPLKDNRLAPLGFTTAHYAYDTTLIVGVPATDIDFNRDALGTEGSGTDITHYHVPMNGYTGQLRIEARVWYQAAPPRWMEEMFDHSTPEIDAFRTMYDAADGTPVLVKEQVLIDQGIGIDDLAELGVRVFPNPVRDGILRIDGLSEAVEVIEVFDLRGALVSAHRPRGERQWSTLLPESGATYLVVMHARGQRFVQRVVGF